MPRIARGLASGHIFHVLNRGNGRKTVFHKSGDYHAMVTLLEEALPHFNVEIYAYCLMPNHFHLLLKPEETEEMCKLMQWLLTSHVRRYHGHYGTSGHVWQGRYKSFIVQDDEHLLTVARYVEGNPVRAELVESAQKWQWSSHRDRLAKTRSNILSDLPIRLPTNWADYTDQPLTGKEIERLRLSVNRQAPFGREEWVKATCDTLGLNSTIRKKGRPPLG